MAVAAPSEYVRHIESFVNSSSSPTQQAASVGAIASLLKNDMLTLESLVKEMDMYLTTTDSIIRARGILLLSELLTGLASKPLDNAAIHSLIGFFTERLADWKALRGALVGCLALLRREGNIGMVSDSDARAVAQSYLQNLEVQSLGQHDRKLCFELLECLLDRSPDAVAPLGDDLLYGICAATDGEKDPRCLMLTFHIVEVVVQLFPDPSGQIASFAEELFEILGSYFPIHFTHPKGEDSDVMREELSRSLMLAFASTPLFEPYAIPLFLEKLSSSLPSAKVDSLKYLRHCTVKYGAGRMEKHVEALWRSLKEAIYALPLASESLDNMGFQENEITTEALTLLQEVLLSNNSLLLGLILGDEDINTTVNSITNSKDHDDINVQSKQKLHAVAHILSASAKASASSCNRVFETFFPRLMGALGISVEKPSLDNHSDGDYILSARPNFRALYLSVELLAACRYLVVDIDELASNVVSSHETWCLMLHRFCHSLTKAFSSTLVTSMDESTPNAYIYSGVKGLQILATFPGTFLPVSKSIFENILMQLISIVTSDFKKKSLWKLVLKALVEIGLFIDKYKESEKAPSFHGIVVEKIVSVLSRDDLSIMPLSLKVEAVADIGMAGLNFMMRIVQGLDDAILANLSNVYVQGDLKSAEFAVQLLECYSYKVLPWFQNIGGFEEVALHFAVNIWEQIGNSASVSISFHQEKLLGATMMAIKHAVGGCSAKIQSTIVHKAFTILSSSTSLVKLEGSQHSHDLVYFSYRDEYIISLFASVVISLRPHTHIPNAKVTLQLFMTTLLSGHLPSAQALGSLVNKLPLKVEGTDASKDFSLEEAIDVIFSGPLMRCCGIEDSSEIGLSSLRLSSSNNRLLQTHAIVGLAWVGKGLLMRGHEKIKDIIMIFLSLLLSNSSIGGPMWRGDPLKESKEQEVLLLMKSAADAFHILMSDSEDCLNKRFNATIRPLYKQRLFNIVMPILLSSVLKSYSSITRSMLYRAFAHVIADTPLSAILNEAKKLIPVILDGMSMLREDVLNKDIIYNVLLVLSGILMEKNGREAVLEYAHIIIRCLIELVSYPHMMVVRETVIQCLIAMSELPHATIYPMKTQVLLAISKALGDPKRVVRQEAVRCRQAWA